MHRRRFLLTSLAGAFAAPRAAGAQQHPGKVARIGFLSPTLSTTAPHVLEAFRQGLRDLGYVEGQNIIVEYRWAEGRAERLPVLAAELVSLKVDVIVASGTPAPLAAKNATKTIPIVMASAGDPVETGLVASLARPGGNVTGQTTLTPDLGGKRLQLVKELLPGVSRVAVLWNAANPYTVLLVSQIEAAARTLRVQIQSLEVRGPDDFENVLPTAISGGAGALIVVDDPLTVSYRTRIVSFASQRRLPAMYGFREFAEAGGLMALGANLPDLYRRAAIYVDKILKGVQPADLPVEQPTKFDLVINLKTARAIGVTVPPALLLRADHVIE